MANPVSILKAPLQNGVKHTASNGVSNKQDASAFVITITKVAKNVRFAVPEKPSKAKAAAPIKLPEPKTYSKKVAGKVRKVYNATFSGCSVMIVKGSGGLNLPESFFI